MTQPVVSVIIPTHERAQYAVPTIRAMLGLKGGVEVVVCDTSAEDHISEALRDIEDPSRLKIVRPGRVLSVVDNFNTALSAATGRYLTFIGDDDFVSEQIVTVSDWAEVNHIDAIKFSFPALYYWPDFRHKTQGSAFAGTLRTSPFSGTVTEHDAKAAALQALSNFGGGVMDMPRAYAGLISRALVDRVQDKYGALFGGVSPDIYSAFLISQESQKCVRIDYPIIVPGASGASTAGQSANGKHVGALRDNAHIRPFLHLVWDQRIPEFYSVPTVWSYSLLKAVEQHGEFVERINFARLYLKCLIFHRLFNNHTLRAMATYRQHVKIDRIFLSSFKAALSELNWIAGKGTSRLLQKVKKNHREEVVRGLENTIAATRALQTSMSQHPTKLNLR